MRLACVKAYDVRGRLGLDLDAPRVARMAQAYAETIRPGRVVIGRDARLSSPALAAAVAGGLRAGGAEALDLGLCGTEEVYHGAFHLASQGVGGGIMVTASHNPADWNGLKVVREEARPIAWDTGLQEINDRVVAAEAAGRPAPAPAAAAPLHLRDAYAALVASFATPGRLRVLLNPGHGAAGPTFDALAPHLPPEWEVVRMDWPPDPSFPQGIPNPLLPGNRARTAAALRESGADLGVAWDGDFDRCFLFDHEGGFVDGEHVVALLARAALAREPGAPIVHEPRVLWAVEEAIREAGGTPVLSRTGHAHFKAALRDHDAPYGGELSAHHYFRGFGFCDSGMIPWLMVAGLLAREDRPLSEMVGSMRARFPSSGEINFAPPDPQAALTRFEAAYAGGAGAVDRTDGLSLDFGAWRANLRVSNTEGLLRLNLETRGDRALLDAKVAELTAFLS